MKPYILVTLTILSLAATGPAFSANDAHDHGNGSATSTLQFNAGKKWETDAPLRTAMGEIRQSVASSLNTIHQNKMSTKAYDGLAMKVEGAVGQIVANCKLPPAADAQLHIVVADLLAGAEQMAGKVKHTQRMDGAVKVIGALDNYGKYFDDAGFKPIKH